MTHSLCLSPQLRPEPEPRSPIYLIPATPFGSQPLALYSLADHAVATLDLHLCRGSGDLSSILIFLDLPTRLVHKPDHHLGHGTSAWKLESCRELQHVVPSLCPIHPPAKMTLRD